MRMNHFLGATEWRAKLSEYPEDSGVFQIDDFCALRDGEEICCVENTFAHLVTTSSEVVKLMVEFAKRQSAIRIGSWNLGTNCNLRKAEDLVEHKVMKVVKKHNLSILFLQEVDENASSHIHAYLCRLYDDDVEGASWCMEHNDDCCVMWLSASFSDSESVDSTSRFCATFLSCAFGDVLVSSYHSRRKVADRESFLEMLNDLADGNQSLFGGDANVNHQAVSRHMPNAPVIQDIGCNTSVTTRDRGSIDHFGSRYFSLASKNSYGAVDIQDMKGISKLLRKYNLSFESPQKEWCKKVPDHKFIWMDVVPTKLMKCQIQLSYEDKDGYEVDEPRFAGAESYDSEDAEDEGDCEVCSIFFFFNVLFQCY